MSTGCSIENMFAWMLQPFSPFIWVKKIVDKILVSNKTEFQLLTSPFPLYPSRIGIVITQNKGLPFPHWFYMRRHRRSVKYDWISFNFFFCIKNCLSLNQWKIVIWHLLREKLSISSHFNAWTTNLFTRKKCATMPYCLHCVN